MTNLVRHILDFVKNIKVIAVLETTSQDLFWYFPISLLSVRDQRVGVFNFGTDRVRVLEKTSGSGSGMDWVRVFAPHFLSIGYYRVLKILIGYFPDKVLSFGSTKVLAALEPLDPSTRLARIYVGFNAILGCCSRRAEQIKEAAQKSD